MNLGHTRAELLSFKHIYLCENVDGEENNSDKLCNEFKTYEFKTY